MIIPLDHIELGLSLDITPSGDNLVCEIVSDAFENGESPHQIGEGQEYEYEFSNSDYRLVKRDYAKPFKNKPHLGLIRPNIYVGTLRLEVQKKSDQNWVDLPQKIEIEVQSVKASYRQDYRHMMEEITEACFDLILQINSPVTQSLSIDFGNDSKTDYQRFSFVKAMIESETFQESIQRIFSAPTTSWSEINETIDIRRVRRINRSGVKQILSKSNRSPLPKNHVLKNTGITSLPERIDSKRKVDSLDTAENRFIKHALEAFLQFVQSFEKSVKQDTREAKEAKSVSNQLEEWLSHHLFKEVSRPTTLNLNSPVLQKKEGYREVLKVWVMFDLAAKLIWEGGEDVYQAGKKDIATLYEYWLFFKLLSLFQGVFKLEAPELNKIIESKNGKLGLKLKQGNHIALKGIFESSSRKLNIEYSFNRSFSGEQAYPSSGSWTKTMRPDYTLSIWPEKTSKKEAETQELITHIHFDAKYKIENFINNISASEEKEDESKGKYKNADLLKMHAYRDAIRRTGGAYVLYPGDKVYNRNGFREIIPGLGAFPVRPSKTDNGISALKDFVQDVIDNLTNRASQKELFESKKYLVHKNKPNDEVREPLPENIGNNRDLHPLETMVNVCFSKDPIHTNWIKKKGIYNLRINERNGSIKITKELAAAKYLVIREKGKFKTNMIFEIVPNRTKVYTRKELIDKQEYPYSKVTNDAYLVFQITAANHGFSNAQWDLSKLKELPKGHESAKNITVSLKTLMDCKV